VLSSERRGAAGGIVWSVDEGVGMGVGVREEKNPEKGICNRELLAAFGAPRVGRGGRGGGMVWCGLGGNGNEVA
jgi:hypothetical protein